MPTTKKTIRIILFLSIFAAIVFLYFDSSEISFLKYETIGTWGLSKVQTEHHHSNYTDSCETDTVKKAWVDFKAKFNKTYLNGSEEDRAHFKCFCHHHGRVSKHSHPNYTVRLYSCSDICPEDFQKTHLNADATNHTLELPPLPPNIEVHIQLKGSLSSTISTSQSIENVTQGSTLVKVIYTTNLTNTSTVNGTTTIFLTMNQTTVSFNPASITTVIRQFCSGACSPDSDSTTTTKSYWGGLPSPVPPQLLANLSNLTPPPAVDWRTLGMVSPAKNQGHCGSCWAFATIGSLESLNLIYNSATNATSDFSEQHLVDCNYFSKGCGGGYPSNALDWQYLNGVAFEADYPYIAGSVKQGYPTNCSTVKTGAMKHYGAKKLPSNNTNVMMSVVAMQPVAIHVAAGDWHSYGGGIYDNCTTNMNHLVLLVGYNSSVWIVKNSWGPTWGENGFIYLARTPACDQMVTFGGTIPLAKPRVADENKYCPYYPSSYCTDGNHTQLMMGLIFILFFEFV